MPNRRRVPLFFLFFDFVHLGVGIGITYVSDLGILNDAADVGGRECVYPGYWTAYIAHISPFSSHRE